MTNDIVLSNGAFQVTIATTKIDDSSVKNLIVVNFPTGSSNWGSGPKTTKIFDFLRVARRFVVNGYIKTDHGSGDTNSAASDKKSNLISLFQAGGVITMAYDGTNFNVNIEKLIITEDPTDEVTVSIYTVNFTAIEGEN